MVLPNLLAERLERAELELLDRTLGAPELRRNGADGPLLGESHLDHPPLVLGKLGHESEQSARSTTSASTGDEN
jgi:hypothetical protein